MSEIPEQFIHEARELLAVEFEKDDMRTVAMAYRLGHYDLACTTRTLARVLFERQQPTFEQRIEAYSAGLADVGVLVEHDVMRRAIPKMDRHLANIIRRKVDPEMRAMEAANKAIGNFLTVNQMRAYLEAYKAELAEGDVA